MCNGVILENDSQATEQVQEGLTDDDYDMYYEIWAQFDPLGSQYIRYDQLSDFLNALEPPLQIHKPNKYKIISMDIAICKGDMMYCVDILDALTLDFFARRGDPIEDSDELSEVSLHQERQDYKPVSSTLWRQREEYCARLIQRFWKRFVVRKNKECADRQKMFEGQSLLEPPSVSSQVPLEQGPVGNHLLTTVVTNETTSCQ